MTSSHRHYAQRYRHLDAQHRRSLEERDILRAEVLLAFNGLEEHEASIAARLATLQTSSGDAALAVQVPAAAAAPAGQASTSGGGFEGWPQPLAKGESAMLTTELSRIQQIHADACRLLAKFKPDAQL